MRYVVVEFTDPSHVLLLNAESSNVTVVTPSEFKGDTRLTVTGEHFFTMRPARMI